MISYYKAINILKYYYQCLNCCVVIGINRNIGNTTTYEYKGKNKLVDVIRCPCCGGNLQRIKKEKP